MASSPTLCQKFVSAAIKPTQRAFSDIYIIHYMDDILHVHSCESKLLAAFAHLKKKKKLHNYGLVIAPEKIQQVRPYSYLGYCLMPQAIVPQKIKIRRDCLKTLNYFQKLLGDINWIRPQLQLTTGELQPLFKKLRGKANSTSLREITRERGFACISPGLEEKTFVNSWSVLNHTMSDCPQKRRHL